jgi:hypothetical protein
VLTDLDLTPKKNASGRTKLKRSFAMADIAAMASDAESEHIVQVSNDEYEPESRAESQGHEDVSNDEPTPKKKQKTVKVPVREAINANRKEHEPHKAENKVSRLY